MKAIITAVIVEERRFTCKRWSVYEGDERRETHLVVTKPVPTGYDFDLRLWPDFALVCQYFLECVGVFGFLDRRTEEGVNLPQVSANRHIIENVENAPTTPVHRLIGPMQ